MNNKITIVVNSFDAYYEVWKGWLHGFKKYWKECSWEVVFMTNYLNAPYGSSSKVGENTNWTYMTKKTLEQIKTPYVLFTVDDGWITDYIDNKSLLEFVDIMERDNITHLRLVPSKDGIEDYNKDSRFKVIKKDSIYRTSLSSALWNKEHFLSFLEEGESCWQFETRGRLREKGNYLVLSTKELYFPHIRQDHPNPIWTGQCVIQQGKWFEGARRYAKLEKINIDFSKNPIENIEEKI